MSNTLNIALVQTHLVWENPITNRTNLAHKIQTISKDADLVVLPEMFSTAFTMNASEVSEPMTGKTVNWMIQQAKDNKVAIVGSLVIEAQNNFYNRLLFVFPNGDLEFYDKRHTFSLAGEDNVYTAGKKKLLVNYKGWKLCPMICYDLRFPVWARNTEDYDVLIYVANWPKIRIHAWDALLKARAIENMTYCIGVNRVGLDGNGHEYNGHSMAFNVLGNRIDTIPESKETVEVISLSKDHINKNRKKFNFLEDRDHFQIE
ncbi:amidohydrolase [Mangrovimonas spongiae]|uniref:Omega-amidase YafV n=1 Tax=Mangrovimonas spongiae TaxID=2494697 RepID=A0A3R9UWR9_9FLAO|nr:amidohydrolase [Mangrovimonas spongiae]RSK41763.1 amidohydrolase [Mangrovimonas spongiae]